MQYQLKLQQLVTYPRCRIYRSFLKSLSNDMSIRTNGSSNLFYFMTLCSLANFRTSTMYIGTSFIDIAPGEWILPIRQLTGLFRVKTERKTASILKHLEDKQYIQYTVLDKTFIKFKINDWNHFNPFIEATAPCTKDDGFFFFPYKMVSEFISNEKCSEMDIVLDLWLNTVYNDNRIPGSDVGPVVYYRNRTMSPLIGYEALGKRWRVSKSTAGRIIHRLEEKGYIKTVTFQSNYGTAIYLSNYLSTMFNISDVIVDKDEVAMALNLKVNVPAENDSSDQKMVDELIESACQNNDIIVRDEQIRVSESESCVLKSHIIIIIKRVLKLIFLQGLTCVSCTRARYILSPLSDDCKRNTKTLELLIRCPGGGGGVYRFRIDIEPVITVLPLQSENRKVDAYGA